MPTNPSVERWPRKCSTGPFRRVRPAGRALQEGPPSWGLGTGATRLNLYSHDSYSGTSFTYSVTPTRLTAPKASLPMGSVYRVEVEVYWWNGAQDNTGSRREVGKLWTRIEQLRYYDD